MQFTVQTRVVIGNNVSRSQCFHPSKAGFNFFRTTVEEYGWEMGAEPVAGEEVAREEKIKAFTVEATVTFGMTGKMDDAESAPTGQFDIGNEWLIDGNGFVPQDATPDCLHEAA